MRELSRWRFTWAWMIGAVLVLGACGGNNPPNPFPTPQPTPTPQPAECLPDVPWCSDTGQTCSSAAAPCKHNPTSDPEHCELAAPCPTPVPTPTPTPPPGTGCVLAGLPGALLPGHVPQLGARVNAAMARLTGCSSGSRCIVVVRPQAWQSAVEAELRADGLCAGQHEPATDEIAVAAAPGQPWEGYHVYAGAGWDDPAATGTVVWSPGANRPAYAPPGGVDPDPDPTPTPAPVPVGCSAPLPPKLWTAETLPDGWGRDEIGRPRWEIACVPHGRVVDCTAKVAPHACGYCASIGMGEAGGQPRCGCPVRNECPGFKCEERPACEAYLSGGTKLESRNGAACEFADRNPWQFRPADGGCRLCSVGDPRVCGGWQ